MGAYPWSQRQRAVGWTSWFLVGARCIVASPEFGTNRIASPATNARRGTTTTLGHGTRTRIRLRNAKERGNEIY
jgi:hypothetical protein